MKRRKDPAAVALGKRGGKARAKALSPERRREIAEMGGAAFRAARLDDKPIKD